MTITLANESEIDWGEPTQPYGGVTLANESEIDWGTPSIGEQVSSLPGIIYRGIGKGAAHLSSGIRAGIEKFDPDSSAIETLKTFESAYPETLEGIETPGKIQQAVGGMTEFAIPMAISAIGGPIGIAAGTGATFTSILGSSYDKYRKQNVEPDRAFNAAFFNSLAQTPLEMAGNLLQIGALKNLVKTFGVTGSAGKRVAAFGEALLKGVVGEGLEEYLQQYPDEIANFYAANPDVEVSDLARYTIDNLKNIHKGGVEAAEIGAIGGGLMVGVGGAIQAPFSIADYRREQRSKPSIQFTPEQKTAILSKLETFPIDSIKAFRESAAATGLENEIDDIITRKTETEPVDILKGAAKEEPIELTNLVEAPLPAVIEPETIPLESLRRIEPEGLAGETWVEGTGEISTPYPGQEYLAGPQGLLPPPGPQGPPPSGPAINLGPGGEPGGPGPFFPEDTGPIPMGRGIDTTSYSPPGEAFDRLRQAISGKKGRSISESEWERVKEDNDFELWSRKADNRTISDVELAEAIKASEREAEDKAFRDWQVKSQKSYATEGITLAKEDDIDWGEPTKPAFEKLRSTLYGKKGKLINAEEIREDEGRVQETGIAGEEGQGEIGQNIQLTEKTGTEAGDKKREIAVFKYFDTLKGKPVPIYELPDGSSVSAQELEKRGIPVPETPEVTKEAQPEEPEFKEGVNVKALPAPLKGKELWSRIKKDVEEREKLAKKIAQSKPSNTIALNRPGERKGVIIHQSTKYPGKFQKTAWDNMGFIGDSTHETFEDAINEALLDGYTVEGEKLFNDVSQSRMFKKAPEYLEHIKEYLSGGQRPSGPAIALPEKTKGAEEPEFEVKPDIESLKGKKVNVKVPVTKGKKTVMQDMEVDAFEAYSEISEQIETYEKLLNCLSG